MSAGCPEAQVQQPVVIEAMDRKVDILEQRLLAVEQMCRALTEQNNVLHQTGKQNKKAVPIFSLMSYFLSCLWYSGIGTQLRRIFQNSGYLNALVIGGTKYIHNLEFPIYKLELSVSENNCTCK